MNILHKKNTCFLCINYLYFFFHFHILPSHERNECISLRMHAGRHNLQSRDGRTVRLDYSRHQPKQVVSHWLENLQPSQFLFIHGLAFRQGISVDWLLNESAFSLVAGSTECPRKMARKPYCRSCNGKVTRDQDGFTYLCLQCRKPTIQCTCPRQGPLANW